MDIISNSVILVVDDVPQNLEVLGTLLRGRGFKVAFASDGEQAIKSATAKVPDLILLDVSMPGMDGFEVCRILKETPETFHIPVIFLTAKSETEEVVKGFDCGGVDYIIKPFKPAELISRVTTHLELKKSREDIALRKVVEQKLKAAKEKAEELSRLKSSLLNNMSHEFRTPLISIIGYSQMMFDEIEDSEQKKMLL
ncbi:MAG: response regulator, partial [Bacillota bacterium]